MGAKIFRDETTSVPFRIPITGIPAGTDMTGAQAWVAFTDGHTPQQGDDLPATIDGTDVVGVIGVDGITNDQIPDGRYVPWAKVKAGDVTVLMRSDWAVFA